MSNESYIFQQIKENDLLNVATNVVGPAFGLDDSSDTLFKYYFPNLKCRLRSSIKTAHLRLKLAGSNNNVFGLFNKTTNEYITTATYTPSNRDISLFLVFICGVLLLPLRSDIYTLFRVLNLLIGVGKMEKKLKNVVPNFHEIENIATKPETQGKGFGSKLIQQMHNMINKKNDNLPIALFCCNAKIYERNGYICWNKIYIDDIPNNGKLIMNAMIYHKDKKELNKLIDKLKESNSFSCF
eukprot:UN05546